MKITEENWPFVKQNYQNIMKKVRYCSIGTVCESGMPNTTPIGSLILTEKGRGFFFDIFPELLAKNIDNNPNICILLINTDVFFWLKSMFIGKFTQPAGFKLLGTAGPKRAATLEEITAFRSIIKPMKPFKGYHSLWSDLSFVREVELTSYFPINTGRMTQTLKTHKDG